MTSVLISLSGGMDSATMLGIARDKGMEIHTIGFTYGSKHNRYEQAAARKLADHYQVPYELIDLSAAMAMFRSDLLLSGGEIPEGHYEHESMTRTVVPGRNLIFIALAAGLAQSRDIRFVAVGVHQGDHAIYPDCRPDFVQAACQTVRYSSENKVTLWAPLLDLNKTKIIARGLTLNVPYGLTRTCYKDQPISCGVCGSCQERLEAFAANGLTDPIPYDRREILPR
jgi:7-cyano-7-deazaguanine synthase